MGAGSSVSVVVITRNRAAALGVALSHLSALPEAPPILVVDNASSDGTVAVARKARGAVRCVPLPENAGAAGRNIGVALAATPYVAFSDDDSWWAPGALTEAVRQFDRYPRLGLLAARVLVGPANRVDPTSSAMRVSPLRRQGDLPGPSILGFIACGAVVRRTAFLRAGGFHPRYEVGGEERLLALDLARRGWGLAYCDDIVAHHHPQASGVRPGRQARMVRNDLWTTWLRADTAHVVRTTLKAIWQGVREPATRAGILAAVRGLPWVLRQRRAIDRSLQAQLARLR